MFIYDFRKNVAHYPFAVVTEHKLHDLVRIIQFHRGNFCTTNPIIAKVSSPLSILDSTSFGERMLEFKSFGRPLLSAERFIFGKSNLSSLEISKLIMSKSSKSLPSRDEFESGNSKDLI